jgi:GTP-binding protein
VLQVLLTVALSLHASLRSSLKQTQVVPLSAFALHAGFRAPPKKSTTKPFVFTPFKKEKKKYQASSAKGIPSRRGKTFSPFGNTKPNIPSSVPKGKVLATQNILGQNQIICRNFRLDSAKIFSFLGSYSSLTSMPSYPLPEVAFVGRSNVGKSSLLNTLTGAHKAIAVESKQPGRTQLMNHFLCKDTDGDICLFTDLPGYGYAKVSKEAQEQISQFVGSYLRYRGALKLTCILVDARREPQDADIKMIQFLNDVGGNFLVIATKVDKLNKNELDASIQNLRMVLELPLDMPILRFSAVTGEGTKQIWHHIKDAMLDDGIFSPAEIESSQDEEIDDYDEDGDYDNEENYN